MKKWILLFLLLPNLAWGATYYMRADGTAANMGAATGPCGTVGNTASIATHNAGTFAADDIIYLCDDGGDYRAALVVPSSGTGDTDRITYQNASGDSPILKGSDNVSGANKVWTLTADQLSTYECAQTDTVDGVIEDGAWMEPATSIATVESTTNSWWWNANKLYVHASGASHDPETNGKTYEASVRNTCITIDGKDYITIDGLDVRHSATDQLLAAGVYVSGDADYITLQNGISQYNTFNGIRIYDPQDGSNVKTSVSILHWTAHHNGKTGILVDNHTVNLLIHGCTAYQNAWFPDATDPYSAGIRQCNWPYVTSAQGSTGTVFEYNVSYNNGKDDAGTARPGINTYNEGFGIWMDTLGTGAVMRYNTAYGNNASAGLRIEATVGAQMYYNIAYSNVKYGILLDTWLGTSGYMNSSNEVYNNTAYGNGYSGIYNSGDGSGTVANSCLNNTFKNNISVGNTGGDTGGENFKAANGGENDGTYGSGNVYLYNCFGADSNADFIRWGWNHAVNTYAEFDGHYGSATSSVIGDPLLVSATDMHILAASPCKNTGTSVSLTRDKDGIPIVGLPDIGAYEYFGVHAGSGAYVIGGSVK